MMNNCIDCECGRQVEYRMGLHKVDRSVPENRSVILLSMTGLKESPIVGLGPTYNSSFPSLLVQFALR
jgi:hypothetical protein